MATTAYQLGLLEKQLGALDASGEQHRQTIERSDATILGAVQRGGLTDAFIAHVCDKEGLRDYYRDTLIGSGTMQSTTGARVDEYLGSAQASTINDKFHTTSKQHAELASLNHMKEAHGEQKSHEREAPRVETDPVKKDLEKQLYQYRASQATYALEAKEFKQQLRDMPEDQHKEALKHAPVTPSLSEEWENKITQSAIHTATSQAYEGKLRNWPFELKNGQDRSALVGDRAAGKTGAFFDRAHASKALKTEGPKLDFLRQQAKGVFEKHMGTLMPDLEAQAIRGTQNSDPRIAKVHDSVPALKALYNDMTEQSQMKKQREQGTVREER